MTPAQQLEHDRRNQEATVSLAREILERPQDFTAAQLAMARDILAPHDVPEETG
jgi:hypothetical protein